MALKINAIPDSARHILEKHSARVLPLTRTGKCSKADAAEIQSVSASLLFPGARAPEAAVSGLLLLAGCWEESHDVSQGIESQEGSYWHAIAHRIEPDAANAEYWFRRVGEHAIFAELHGTASKILHRRGAPWALKRAWDPFQFIGWCDDARRAPGTEQETIALEIQRAEWELLFKWCASEPVRK